MLLVGGVLFVLAYENGSYETTTWAAAAVLVWWALGLAVVGVLPGDARRVRRLRSERSWRSSAHGRSSQRSGRQTQTPRTFRPPR